MKKVLKYQLSDLKIVLIVYFAVMIAIAIIAGIAVNVMTTGNGMADGTISFGASGSIVCLITGIVMFKEHFWMLVQNGINRKNFFKSTLCTVLIFSTAFSLIEGLLSVSLGQVLQSLSKVGTIEVMSMTEMIFSTLGEGAHSFSGFIINLIVTVTVTAFLFMLGFFIAGIYYRIPKKLKMSFAVGLPLFFMLVLPMIASLFPQKFLKLMEILVTLMGVSSGRPLQMAGFFFVLSALFVGGNYLIIRRAEV